MSTLPTMETPTLGKALFSKEETHWTVPKISPYSRQASIDNQKYIFNVGPRPHLKHTPLGPYYIPACPEGAEYSEPCVIPGIIFETVPTSPTERKMENREVDGGDFARDLIGIGPHQDYKNSLARQGCFVSSTRIPAPEEVAKARAELDKLYSDWIGDADRCYSLNNGMIVIDGMPKSAISERHMEAAKQLGVQRPWRNSSRRQMECDQCGEANLVTASRCKNRDCKKVFNLEADRKNFPYEYLVSDEPERRGPGRPAKVA